MSSTKRQFGLFVVAGLLSTGANFAAVAIARQFALLPVALLFGIAAGFISSFLLNRYFVFKEAAESGEAGREAAKLFRFALVWGFGASLYWTIGAYGAVLLERVLDQVWAEILATGFGASTMVVTSYTLHRLFTFRTPVRPASNGFLPHRNIQ